MASFYAYDFVYDDIPSQKWDLKIITFEDGGLFNGVGSSDVNIITQRVLRKSKPYYLGRTQETVLEFPLTFGTAAPISGMDRDLISAWLFGRSIYKRLYILQDDLNGAYFNCLLTKPEPLYIGGLNYAFTCNVTCDSPWAYSSLKTVSGSISDLSPTVNIDIYNNSSEDEYLYPMINFDMSTPGAHWAHERVFRIINNTDDLNRPFTFIDVYAGDNITVDNDLQIVTLNSYNPNLPFPRTSQVDGTIYNTILEMFNKNWLRLMPRNNNITISTDDEHRLVSDANYTITWTERMKIGG
jgi:hypothetical protein